MTDKRIEIMDTTLRDGEQMDGVSYSCNEKIMIAKRLLSVGIPRIEVASSNAVSEDKRALEEICKMADVLGKQSSVEVLGFVRNDSVDWIADAGCSTMNLLMKGSRKHRELQLKKSLTEHLSDVSSVISYANSRDVSVNVYLEDWSGGMKESREDVFKTIDFLRNTSVKRIMLADTRGLLDYRDTEKYVKELTERFPDVHFDYHGHNDRGLAVANSMSAAISGAKGVHVAQNGLGERAGNCSMYELVANLSELGFSTGVDEKSFLNLSRMIEQASKVRLSPHTPIVGSNVFVNSAGVHADGNKKGDLYRTLFFPERFGAESTKYSLGKNSGAASIELNLKELGLDADSELVRKLTHSVRELGGKKQRVSQGDLFLLYMSEINELKERPFSLIDFRSDVKLKGKRTGYVEAKIYGKTYRETAAGNGGYDAVANAMKKITSKHSIKLPELIDFDVLIPSGGGTNSMVETIITWKNGGRAFKTTGEDTDQTVAAVKATENMINMVMLGLK